jgi:carbon catabolite-derepressing protein kinase
MLMVDPVKRLTVREILKHPWVAKDIAPSLQQTQKPVLDSLSSLVSVRSAKKTIKGLGELDGSIVETLAAKLDVNETVVLDALDHEHENAVKVAYRIIRDGHSNKGAKPENPYMNPSSHSKIQPIFIPTIPANPNRGNDYFLDDEGYGDELEDDEDDEFGAPIDWSEENSFAVLNTSLVGDAETSISLPLFGPPRPPLLPSPSQRAGKLPNSGRTRRHGMKQPRWHFGIRSGNPPMEVIYEIYRTLKDLGIEWREKGGEWSVNATEEVGSTNGNGMPTNGAVSHEMSDVFSREAIDIFFIETRWRVDNTWVRMDLQLYQVDDTSYLVDFRNVGYHRIPTSGAGTNSTASPSTTPMDSSVFLDQPPSGGDPSYKTKADGSGVLSPFLFMDCAHKLILELAGAS